jgi:hypothetical protein
MDNLLFEAKKDTPRIYFSKEKKIFEMSGKSLPEDVVDFYEPVLNWLKEYVKDPLEETVVVFKLEYINSTSSKIVAEMLEIFEMILESGKIIRAKWYYPDEDDDIKLTGEEFSETMKFNIDLVPTFS